MSHIGWRTSVLAGGYKAYRRRVKARLYDEDLGLQVVLLDGCTGTGKTEILRLLSQKGVQTIDLEEVAQHRGSVFGATPGNQQPSQKMFESRLSAAIDALDRERLVVIEAEGSKIGDRSLPPTLWKAMTSGKRIVLSAPAQARARHLVERYAATEQHRALLATALDALIPQQGRKTILAWRALLEAGDFEGLAAELFERHYDPAYGRVAAVDTRPVLRTLSLQGLSAAELERAAREIAKLAAAESPNAALRRTESRD